MTKTALTLALALLGTAGASNLTVWTHFTSAEEATWLRQQAAAYGRATGHRVTVVSVPLDQMADKLIQAAPRGQGPDLIVALPQDRLGQLAAAGVIEPMDRWVWSEADLDRSVMQAMTYRGKLLGLPMFAEAVALVYNKRLVPQAPATWNEFLAAARANTGDGRFGFLVDLSNAYMNYGLFSAYGGYVFKNSRGTLDASDIGLNNPGALRAAALLNDLRYKYGLVPEGVTGDAAKSAFLEGRLAMLVTGPWDIGDFKKANLDYGITVLPQPPGAPQAWSPFVGVQGIVMNAYSRDKAAAGRLAQALVTSTAQVSFNRAGGRIPVSLKARAQLKSDPVVTGFSRAIAAGTPMPNVPQMGAVWKPWSDAVALSVQSRSPNYAAIFGKAVQDIRAALR